MNSVFLLGRLTRKPELQQSSNQNPYCRNTLAVDRSKEQTDFIPFTVFGKTAELLCKYKEKGELILLEGSLRSRQYEKEGKTNFGLEVIGRNIQFIPQKSQEENEKKFEKDELLFPENCDEALPF